MGHLIHPPDRRPPTVISCHSRPILFARVRRTRCGHLTDMIGLPPASSFHHSCACGMRIPPNDIEIECARFHCGRFACAVDKFRSRAMVNGRQPHQGRFPRICTACPSGADGLRRLDQRAARAKAPLPALGIGRDKFRRLGNVRHALQAPEIRGELTRKSH